MTAMVIFLLTDVVIADVWLVKTRTISTIRLVGYA